MKKAAALFSCALVLVNAAFAGEGAPPKGIPHLDHVFLMVMENHGYSQIINNPNAPFINQYANSANAATNYFAIGHPSLTNYLELVGGVEFRGAQRQQYGLARRRMYSEHCCQDCEYGQPGESQHLSHLGSGTRRRNARRGYDE